ncbi:MAG: hypothetical protein HC852_05025 [Acaryochloridaceae cyanobacterium RU_4_10]|nr:hypothetical protein [Acaryochloridaceae cyanobacterium RU_4_10]
MLPACQQGVHLQLNQMHLLAHQRVEVVHLQRRQMHRAHQPAVLARPQLRQIRAHQQVVLVHPQLRQIRAHQRVG